MESILFNGFLSHRNIFQKRNIKKVKVICYKIYNNLYYEIIKDYGCISRFQKKHVGIT